jgi:hypothetical protein
MPDSVGLRDLSGFGCQALVDQSDDNARSQQLRPSAFLS